MADHFTSNAPSSETDSWAGPENGAGGTVGGEPGGKPGGKPPMATWKRMLLIVVGVFVALIVVVGAGLAVSLFDLKGKADAVMDDASSIQAGMISGDSDKIREATQDAVEQVRGMHGIVTNPFFAVASVVPGVGADVAQAQVLFASLDDLVSEVIVPLEDTIANLRVSEIIQPGGVISIEALQGIDEIVQVATEPVSALDAELQSMGDFSIDPVNDAFQRARSQVASLNNLLQTFHELTPYLPGLLGADGQTKTYLIGALNPSEQRPSGGLMGAWGTLSFTDGKATLSGFTPATQKDLPLQFGEAEENAILTKGMMLTPDFPHAAQIVETVWTMLGGTPIDGFVAVDPIFLQDILKIMGPVTAANGMTVDGENASQVILHEAYLQMTPEDQDKFFADVAGRAFQAIFTNAGGVNPKDFLEVVTKGVEHKNIQIWMKDEAVEAVLAKFGVTGELSRDPKTPVLGIYDTDLTFSKIDWYLRFETEVGEGVRNEDGSTTYPVTSRFTNVLTPEEVQSLPTYVTGYNSAKREKGDIVSMLTLWAPFGGSISDVTTEGGITTTNELHELYGFQLAKVIIQDLPGEQTVVRYNVTTSPEATEPLQVDMAAKPRDIP